MHRPFDFRALLPLDQQEVARVAARISAKHVNGELKLFDIDPGLNSAIAMLTAMGQVPGEHLMLYRALGRALVGGPKVFRPSYAQCLALEQVAIDLTLNDYQQPYEVMLIEFPPQYIAERESPSIAVVHRDPLYLLAYMKHKGRDSLCFSSSINLPLERLFTETARTPTTVAITSDRPAFRVALNACLILSRYAHRLSDLGSRAVFRENLERRRRRGDRTPLRMPQELTLVQHIDFHVEDRQASSVSQGETGTSVQPHWRKGHWRRQAFGAGWGQHRLVFIRPVLVNGHLDSVSRADRQAIYYGHDARPTDDDLPST
jgi:hypothetical protein